MLFKELIINKLYKKVAKAYQVQIDDQVRTIQ